MFPIDPRPGSDGPANFYIDADFELTSISAAIDNAWKPRAITTDFLGNSQVKITGAGFGLPGYGPRDVGAFEFEGTAVKPWEAHSGLSPRPSCPSRGRPTPPGATTTFRQSPTSVTVTFSGNVNPADISATDLAPLRIVLESVVASARHQSDLD